MTGEVETDAAFRQTLDTIETGDKVEVEYLSNRTDERTTRQGVTTSTFDHGGEAVWCIKIREDSERVTSISDDFEVETCYVDERGIKRQRTVGRATRLTKLEEEGEGGDD